MPPVVTSPVFAIRKPAAQIFTLDDYVAAGTLSRDFADILRGAVWDRQNILIAGGTSTGKTTLANALLAEIAATGDRVVIIEDTRELQCAGEGPCGAAHPARHRQPRRLWCAARFAFGPTASSSARCVAPRRSPC